MTLSVTVLQLEWTFPITRDHRFFIRLLALSLPENSEGTPVVASE